MISKIFTLWVFKKKTRAKYPQKSLVNLLYTWTEPRQDINQQNIIFKKQIFYSQMTRLHQNNNLNYSRLLRPVAHSRERNRSNGKNYINTYCESKHKEMNYRITHFLVVSKAFFFPYDIKKR